MEGRRRPQGAGGRGQGAGTADGREQGAGNSEWEGDLRLAHCLQIGGSVIGAVDQPTSVIHQV